MEGWLVYVKAAIDDLRQSINADEIYRIQHLNDALHNIKAAIETAEAEKL